MLQNILKSLYIKTTKTSIYTVPKNNFINFNFIANTYIYYRMSEMCLCLHNLTGAHVFVSGQQAKMIILRCSERVGCTLCVKNEMDILRIIRT